MSIFLSLFQGSEVDLNLLKKMSSEYAEAKNVAINGTFDFSYDTFLCLCLGVHAEYLGDLLNVRILCIPYETTLCYLLSVSVNIHLG